MSTPADSPPAAAQADRMLPNNWDSVGPPLKVNPFTRFLWWSAGADVDLLSRCPGSDRVKYEGLGGVVLAVLLARFGRAPFLGFIGAILRGAVLTAGAGYGLSFLVTYIALASAWWHGVRVWLGSAQHRSRREGFWPPRGGGANRAALVGLTTLILTLYGVGAIGLVTLGMVIAPRFAGLGAGPVAALRTAEAMAPSSAT